MNGNYSVVVSNSFQFDNQFDSRPDGSSSLTLGTLILVVVRSVMGIGY